MLPAAAYYRVWGIELLCEDCSAGNDTIVRNRGTFQNRIPASYPHIISYCYCFAFVKQVPAFVIDFMRIIVKE